MQRFLKIVGNGRKTARDLTAIEAEEAFEMVMGGQSSEAQTATLMAALRIKEESADELAAFVRVLRRNCQRLDQPPPPNLVDVCPPYDGRSKTPLLVLASALIAAAGGAKVTLHGRLGGVLPPKFGVGIGDVLERLNVAVRTGLEESARSLDEIGIAFISAEKFAPCMLRFDQIRLDYGMRSFFHTIEKLVNPFNAETAMVGVFHQPVMPRVAGAVQALGYTRGLVVQGPEGSVDVLSSRRNPIIEFRDGGEPTEWSVDPTALGWWERTEETRTFDPQADAELTLSLLDPAQEPPHRRSALLTAALILYASGKAITFESGLQLAQESLRSGAGLERLTVWQETSRDKVRSG